MSDLPDQIVPATTESPLDRIQSVAKFQRFALAALVLVAIGAFSVISAGGSWNSRTAYDRGRSSITAPLDGKIATINVKEGDWVEEGQIIATLDPAPYQAALTKAQGEYSEAVARAGDTGIAVATAAPDDSLPNGTIVQNGPLKSPIQSQLHSLTSPTGTKPGAGLSAAKTDPGVITAETELDKLSKSYASAKDSIGPIQAEIASYESQIDSSKEMIVTAQKNLESAQIVADKAKADADKMHSLLIKGAVAARDSSRADLYAQTTGLQVDSSKKALESASSTVNQLQSQKADAEARLKSAQAIVSMSPDKISAAKNALEAARTRVSTGLHPGAELPKVDEGATLPKPAGVKLQGPVGSKPQIQGPVKPEPVQVNLGAKAEADKDVTEAQIALQKAQDNMDATHIKAKKAGRIVKIVHVAGDEVHAGQTIIIIKQF